jgi:hypothetical protein
VCHLPRAMVFEAARAKAVPVLFEVDKLQWVASGRWSNARASNRQKQKLIRRLAERAWKSQRRMVPTAVTRWNRRHRSRLISPRCPEASDQGRAEVPSGPSSRARNNAGGGWAGVWWICENRQLVKNKRDDGTAASSLIDDSRQIHRCATRSWQA